VRVVRQVALELDPVEAPDAPLGVRVDEEVLLGARDIVEDEVVAADVLEVAVDLDADGGHLGRGQDLAFDGSRDLGGAGGRKREAHGGDQKVSHRGSSPGVVGRGAIRRGPAASFVKFRRTPKEPQRTQRRFSFLCVLCGCSQS
jgi:hypothetical protein